MRLIHIAELLLACSILPFAAVAQEAPAAPAGAALEPAPAVVAAPVLTADAINLSALEEVPAEFRSPILVEGERAPAAKPDPAIVKLQVLLDRAGASPGVIDGFDGDNVRKAIVALEIMSGHNVDGIIDPDLLGQLDTAHQAIGSYVITDEDIKEVTGEVPADYAEKAKMEFLGYASVAEALAEKFHMDIDLLKALNPSAQFVPGETVLVADVGAFRTGQVARIEADKSLRQVRAYDANGGLIAAYPATIGSEDNPSPTGTHLVDAVVQMPNYTYNPKIHFQQGENTEVLTIPPGPNGPVGAVWIDLTEPTFGIHGTPEPAKIDKTASHGCVRLTNWDAQELSHMVAKGVPVDFVG
ncbi:MAG TPA: L,D-transpeptidase [Devosia sp.]|nr:L,D-transpeptidase [Devosia sp.]